MESSLVAFLGIAALVIVTPGPDTALTIRNTLGGGRRGGLGTALGVAAGQGVWTVATSAGIAALLVASASVFAALRLAARPISCGSARRPCGPCPRAAARPDRGATPATAAGQVGGLPAGHPQQPREPEDGGLLHQPPAAVRAGRRASFPTLSHSASCSAR